MSGTLLPTHHSAHESAAQAAAEIPRASDATRVEAFRKTFATPFYNRLLDRAAEEFAAQGSTEEEINKTLFNACDKMQDIQENMAALNRMRSSCHIGGVVAGLGASRRFDEQYPGDDTGRLIAFQEDTGMLPTMAEIDLTVVKRFVTRGFTNLHTAAESASCYADPSVIDARFNNIYRLPVALKNVQGDDNTLLLDVSNLTHMPDWFKDVLPRFSSISLVVGEAGVPDIFKDVAVKVIAD